MGSIRQTIFSAFTMGSRVLTFASAMNTITEHFM